jgi:hypothetical protein
MLSERGGYEICRLCNWEDDGQDDPHAEEVWGGPNRHSDLELQAKRQIVAAFEAMRGDREESAVAELWAAVRDGERVLESEVQRRVREYEARDH